MEGLDQEGRAKRARCPRAAVALASGRAKPLGSRVHLSRLAQTPWWAAPFCGSLVAQISPWHSLTTRDACECGWLQDVLSLLHSCLSPLALHVTAGTTDIDYSSVPQGFPTGRLSLSALRGALR